MPGLTRRSRSLSRALQFFPFFSCKQEAVTPQRVLLQWDFACRYPEISTWSGLCPKFTEGLCYGTVSVLLASLLYSPVSEPGVVMKDHLQLTIFTGVVERGGYVFLLKIYISDLRKKQSAAKDTAASSILEGNTYSSRKGWSSKWENWQADAQVPVILYIATTPKYSRFVTWAPESEACLKNHRS